ncbi:TIGR03088 family PEP-CTERM/XrtA system glycosyltransferase [Acidovorax sp.]|uniref:TIGR03088 family PEP-CTERM/XrtA system glycosyltransferase n=1 Tax=Acidovorax sp. TaxID=1872122 RepID=UPI0025C5E24B|nr:TIGR03088 family PEP-CTERM/XrtA system glycosyltransferase [Acidovorax sp.]
MTTPMTSTVRRRRIVHVVYSFSVGGLENVIVQLINRLPADQFEHVVLSLTTISDFKNRITQPGVRFIELHKPPGHAIPLYPRIYKLLRELKPDVVHTCNLAALEITPLAWLARVPLRVHAEHGWDAHDPQGQNPRYQRLRKLYKPFVSHYVSVSKDLDDYLARAIGVPASRRSLIANGVDTDTFSPRVGSAVPVPGCPFVPGLHWLVGTVGRLQTVKNQPLLARAFVRLLREHPEAAERARLVIVGEGPLRAEVEAILEQGGASHLAWLPGGRSDIPDVLRMLDCFVLPSETEGTSCTLQEAMSCGLQCIATAVGGTPELLALGRAGVLVKPGNADALADALARAFANPDEARQLGHVARELALSSFGMAGMVRQYLDRFSLGRAPAIHSSHANPARP